MAFLYVLGMRRSVMQLVYSLASCFTMVSSPAFSASHFSFSSALLPLPMTLLVVLLRGLFVLLQLGRCRIILSRILLIVL